MGEGTGGEIVNFVQTMKDWRRMCKDRSCDNCGLKGSCDVDPDSRTDYDIAKIVGYVTAWAEKNPETIYPTWLEWLESNGLIKCNDRADSIDYLIRPTLKARERIPAGIAQKYGIKPKEG